MFKKRIVSIKKVGTRQTYDLQTPVYHNFFLDNGILSHNSGKSWFSIQLGSYLDPTLTLDNLVFTPEDFRKRVLSAKKYQCIIYDEAITGMRAARWASEVNQAIVEMMGQMRQLNLFIIVVIPSFFELGRYVALYRSQALLMTYKDKMGKRGHFSAFNYNKKKYMYIVGKKTYNERITAPDFFGRFTGFFPLDEAAYRKKKLDALNAVPEKPLEGVRAMKWRARLKALCQGLKKEGFTAESLAQLIENENNTVKISSRDINRLGNEPFGHANG